MDTLDTTIRYGGMDADQLLRACASEGICVSGWAWDMIRSKYFEPSPRIAQINVERRPLSFYGINEPVSDYRTISDALVEQGRIVVPVDFPAHYRRCNGVQVNGTIYYYFMQPLPNRHGEPAIFCDTRSEDGAEVHLRAALANRPDQKGLWLPSDEIVSRSA